MFPRATLVNETNRPFTMIKYGWCKMDLAAFEEYREGPYCLSLVNKRGWEGPEPGMLPLDTHKHMHTILLLL